MDTRLIDHVNESLGIASREVFDHLKFVAVGENGYYHIDTLICRKCGADQPFPCGKIPEYHNSVNRVGGCSPE